MVQFYAESFLISGEAEQTFGKRKSRWFLKGFFNALYPPTRWHWHPSSHCQSEGLGQATLAPLHLVHEDHIIHGAHGDDARDPQGARLQQLRVRAARVLHAAVHVGQPGPRRLCPVGDGGVQAAAPVTQRRPLQADLGYLHRLQEHCLKDRQRAETVSAEEQRGEMGLKGGGDAGEGGGSEDWEYCGCHQVS